MDDILNDVINRSIYESKLYRNPSIRLDINQHNCTNTEVNESCSICQLKFKTGDNLTTLQDCNHTFHYNCIQEWGKYKQDCPLCRKSIPILET